MASSKQIAPGNDVPSTPSTTDRFEKVRTVVAEEFGPIHPRLVLLRALLAPIPSYAGGRIRARALRAAGLKIGHGTVIWDTPRMYGPGDIYSRFSVGVMSAINVGCFFDLNGSITIGDNVGIGHEVMFLTSSHKLGPKQRRNGPLTVAPITVGNGVWIGARAVILPGVTIGEGAVISAGAVVNKDVPPNSLVAGAPASVIVPRLPGS